MATAPYGLRLLVGAATVAVEETLKLPKTILMYPMTLASQAAHMVMRFQQNLAELVIKGDATLEALFPPNEEQPEWATFDEDVAGAIDEAPTSALDTIEGDRRAQGRFALYSVPEGSELAASTDSPTQPLPKHAKSTAQNRTAPLPSVATELGYEELTLAQLRARLQTLHVDELEALLAYEQATKARAPFQTLLANRITRTTAK